jgi:hypothetical protein
MNRRKPGKNMTEENPVKKKLKSPVKYEQKKARLRK